MRTCASLAAMDNMETQAWDVGFCEMPVRCDEAKLQQCVVIRVLIPGGHMYTKDTKNDSNVLLGNLEKELDAVTGLWYTHT